MEVEYSQKSEKGLNNSQVARPTESAYRSSKQQSSNDGQPVVTNTLGEKSMLEAVMGKPVTTADVEDFEKGMSS